MPDLPPPDPDLGDEEVRTIADNLMVFRSPDEPTPKPTTKAIKLKVTKNRCKTRLNTPAPPSKGNGRKRFVPSPLPEDKQLRKKLSFGYDSGPGPESPRCKAAIFSESPDHDTEKEGRENDKIILDHKGERQKENLALEDNAAAAGASPAGTRTVGDLMAVGEGTVKESDVIPSDLDAASEAKSALECARVNLPEMAKETNMLCESAFVPYSSGVSHDALHASLMMQPKKSSIMHVASLDSAERLDTWTALPLLAGNPPEDANSIMNPSTMIVAALETPSALPVASSGLSVEDFPPLVPGRTRKLRANGGLGSDLAESPAEGISHPRYAGPRGIIRDTV